MKEVASGCVPWRTGKNGVKEVLVVLRTGGYWEFPKGKREGLESDLETATRELKEETGLTGEIDVERKVTFEYEFNRKDVRYEKTVYLFPCRVKEGARVRIQRSEISDHAWIPLEDVAQKITYPEGKEVARRMCELLKD